MDRPCSRSSLLLVAVVELSRPRDAAAQGRPVERLSLAAEGGLGTMFPQYQRSFQGYDRFNGLLTLRAAFEFFPAANVQVSYAQWTFFSDRGNGGLISLTAGLRGQPRVTNLLYPWFDGNIGVGFTGPAARFVFDLGAGLDVRVLPWLGVGPALRFGMVVQAPGSFMNGSPAAFWSGGAMVTLRLPHAAAATRAENAPAPLAPVVTPANAPRGAGAGHESDDSDGDGVIDSLDVCPREASGAHPDRRRLGCPLRDTDGDGIPDVQDLCPSVPAGATPDPNRPGCPDHDMDNDGVGDHADRCVEQFGGFVPNDAAPGCPLPDRDHDWVPDATDRCPGTPGAPNRDAARHGCPSGVRLEPGVIVAAPFGFARDATDLDPRGNAALTAVSDLLASTLTIHTVAVGVGSGDELAQRRAARVIEWLVADGIDRRRLEVAPADPTARRRGVTFTITAMGPPLAPAPAPPAH